MPGNDRQGEIMAGGRRGDCCRRCVGALRQNVEELRSFGRGFQIEVVFANYALGIARLQRRLADRAEPGDEEKKLMKECLMISCERPNFVAIRARCR